MIDTVTPKPIALVTTVDPQAIDVIARLGGNTCAATRERFEMLTPSLES
jgi:hypothetical protein